MKRLIAARLFLAIVGFVVWGYGQRAELSHLRLAGMGILIVVLLLRFVPPRWLDGDSDRTGPT